MKIAVVILNWNGKNLLEQFLPSVIQYSEGANIYVADNASTDNSVKFLVENYPEITILQNSTNGGYARGYNEALAPLNEDLFVLLNSDVEVSSNWISPIAKAFQEQHHLVAAQPKILDFNNKELFEYAGAAGGFIDALGYPFCKGRIFSTLEKDHRQYDNPNTIFWASGACLCVRSKAFFEVGGLDEDFFAHQEEIDLCWRLQANGGIVRCIPESEVFHVGGATLTAANAQKTFFNFRNTLLMLLKNVKGPKVYLYLICRLLLDGIAAIQMLFLGKFKHILAILRAHISFYTLLPKFLKKRQQTSKLYKYARVNSIVWSYFIEGKKKFSSL